MILIKEDNDEHRRPPLLDRYLARTGYASQQIDPPLPARQPDNLFESLDDTADERGAHGQFDQHAHHHDPQLWASHHPCVTAIGIAALAASITAGITTWRHRG